MRKTLVIMVSTALFGCTSDPVEDEPVPEEPERESFPYIVDEQGRVLILHGINVMSASKGAEDRMPPIDESVVQRMADDWGFTISRFLIFWDHVEPEPGEIDQGYLDDVAERLDWHADAGIHVVLDMHQDVYAERFCCDGAPEWAIRDDGEPFEMQSQWFVNYFQPAVQRSFDNFFLYTDGEHADLQDHYMHMWAAGPDPVPHHPAVLGYDLMNEPSCGTWTDPLELLGEENPAGPHADFDRDLFQPFYQRLIDRIREVDTESWIFFEPRYGAPANGMPSYMGVLTDPRPEGDRLVYAPHLYSILFEATGSYSPDTDLAIPNWEENRAEEMAAQDCPLLIGEWGFDSSWENADQAYLDVLAVSERVSQGWMYWSLDPGGWGIVDSDWNEKAPVDRLVHPHPRAIAGVPLSYRYDHDGRVMRLEFTDREGVEGPTEIYVAASRHYPDGWELVVGDPDGTWTSTFDEASDIVSVETSSSDDVHVIEIRPL